MSILKFLSTNGPAIGKDSVEELLSHEFTNNLTREDNTFIWKGNKEPQMMGGLTKLIKKRFYPEGTQFKKKTNSCVGRGKKVGTLVHRQIYHMIVCEKKQECNCTTKTNPRRLNILTKQAFQLFSELEFTPLDAEVIIISKTARFCTQLDVIGNRWNGTPKQRSVIISIKTGYSTEYNTCKGNAKMSEPLEFLSSTARNHNQLQGMLERYILKREYNITFDEYHILYLGHHANGQPMRETLDSWCLSDDVCEKVYQTLCKTQSGKAVVSV